MKKHEFWRSFVVHQMVQTCSIGTTVQFVTTQWMSKQTLKLMIFHPQLLDDM